MIDDFDAEYARLVVAGCRVSVNLPPEWRTLSIAGLEGRVRGTRARLAELESELEAALWARIAEMSTNKTTQPR
jgi:hypothetical protein